jgi:hypothetical protein
MKKNWKYEIVPKYNASGMFYWITDKWGVMAGPYDTVKEAALDVPKGQLQYPLPLED